MGEQGITQPEVSRCKVDTQLTPRLFAIRRHAIGFDKCGDVSHSAKQTQSVSAWTKHISHWAKSIQRQMAMLFEGVDYQLHKARNEGIVLCYLVFQAA